jgi:type II secretory pathway component PulK
MVIALVGSIGFFIASNTYYSALQHSYRLQGLRGEFILKSTLNVARVLIANSNARYDPPSLRDNPFSWALFTQGRELPLSFLGVTNENRPTEQIKVGLEITGNEGKLSLKNLVDNSQGSTGPVREIFIKWRSAFVRLFQQLDFDNDGESDWNGAHQGRFFDSEQLVANIIDFMDTDEESYNDSGFASGIESDIKKGVFPNRPIQKMSELDQVPGFTPARLAKLAPFVTATSASQINVNVAAAPVLKSLDPELNDAQAAAIISFAQSPEGPFTQDKISTDLPSLFPNFTKISSLITAQSSNLSVIAKVQFGEGRYFLRAEVEKASRGFTSGAQSGNQLPTVKSIEMFG